VDFRCPGQDTLFWKPEDILETPCPVCGYSVEFFKDDLTRKCPNCGYTFKNPKLDLGCTEWCPYADKCVAEIGKLPGGTDDAEQDPGEEPEGGIARC